MDSPSAPKARPGACDPSGALSDILRESRHEAGLPQRELARRIGRAPSHVAMIECGRRRVDTLEFYRIARALEIEPADLFSRVAREIDRVETGLPT